MEVNALTRIFEKVLYFWFYTPVCFEQILNLISETRTFIHCMYIVSL